jgi:5'-AMP-activated protein kinase catalytic alpha subunit
MWSAGVILYALLCGSLPFDDDVIFKLFKKIKAGTYPTPSFLSEDSRGLISRLLCVDPLKRITVPEVRRHSWFKYRLPPYLAVAPAALQQAQRRAQEELDEDAIDDLLRVDAIRPLAKHRALVKEWLLRGSATNNQASSSDALTKMCAGLRIAYELVLDVRVNRNNVAQHRAVADNSRSAARPPAAFSPSSGPSSRSTASTSIGSAGGEGGGEQGITRRSWYLGIQSKKDPAHVMAEVFRSLRSLRCQWNVVSPYRLLCRWRPSCSGLNDLPHSDVWIYAALQVYKIQSKVYLLDFQRVGSHSAALDWMMLCTLIINSLKPPSRADRPPGTVTAGGGGG